MEINANTHELTRDGFTILPAVLTPAQCASLIDEVSSAINDQPDNSIGAGKGRVVGSRNLMDHWTLWRTITETPVIRDFVGEHVGPQAGLVRILFFDKPPGRSWSLSMHRDRTIAVAKHHTPPDPFSKPTVKAGVPHVEATEELLERMLTLRVHLDPMHDENGPLVVIPGSHISATDQPHPDITTIQCDLGDVFAMRPLLSHGSRAASEHTKLHRRVLHLEIAPEESLPAAYRWHQFEPISIGH